MSSIEEKKYYFYRCLTTGEISKEELLEYTRRKNLKLPRKNAGVETLLDLIKKNCYDEFYEEYKDKVYIPYWELAEYLNISSRELLEYLEEMKLLEKYKTKNKEFFSSKDKEYFEALSYELDVLDINKEEVKEALKKYYYNGLEIRIENKNEEALEIIKVLKSKYEIKKEKKYKHRSGEGSYVYIRVRKITCDFPEVNKFLSRIESLNEEKRNLEKKLSEIGEKNRKLSSEIFRLKTEVERLNEQLEKETSN